MTFCDDTDPERAGKMLSCFLAAGGVIDTANGYFGERQQRIVPCSRTCSGAAGTHLCVVIQ